MNDNEIKLLVDAPDSIQFSSWCKSLGDLRPLIEQVGAKTGETGIPLPDILQAFAELKEKSQESALCCEEKAQTLYDAPYVSLDDKYLQKANLPALAATAFLRNPAHANKDAQDAWLTPLLIAAVLGETLHTLPYHNNLHFRKVALHAARLITAHNAIPGQENPLGTKDSALLLIAACIHDLGHDGMGNIGVGGAYNPGRLERRSFEYAKPYLEAAGMNKTALADLEIMLICTDAARPDNPSCPLTQLRAASSIHLSKKGSKAKVTGGGEIFDILIQRRDLALLSLFLHEADIMNSAGVSSAQTALETMQFKQERKEDRARPSDVLEFMGTVCRGGFLSEAGKTLGQAAYTAIHARAQKDFAAGNAPYSSSESTGAGEG